MVLIGSTNTLNPRTPYSYEDRKRIIEVSFPSLEILPLPDAKPNLEYFDGTTNDAWLDSIEKIAKERMESFVFCGGSDVDLEILSQRFETILLVDREAIKISATEVRRKITECDLESLASLVDPKALEIIITKIKKVI